jgi:phosphatidylglycerophosphate synthase
VAAIAAASSEALLLCADDLVAHTAVLRHLATAPVGQTVALVLPDAPVGRYAAVREDRGRLVAAGSPAEPTGVFGGALLVGVDDLPALVAAATTGEDASGETGMTSIDLLLPALVRTGMTIFTHRVRLLVAARIADQAALTRAEAAVAAVDSDAAELRLSVKEKDDFFTTYFVSTWSPYLARLAARFGLGPSAVTAISVLLAVVAAVLLAGGGRVALIAGAALLYLSFVLDCVDGQLARYTRQFSAFGGWLDTMADRAKEYVVYVGLGVGAVRAGYAEGWTLTIAAMVLQTVRHMTDTWYGVLHDEAATRTAGAGAGAVAAGGIGDRLSQASNRVQSDTGSVAYWLKRTVVFPIGERWALIALTVAFFNQRVALVAVLGWGALAAAYTLALRTLRARSMRVPVMDTVDTSLYRDDGFLARCLGTAGFRLTRGIAPLPFAAVAVLAAIALLAAAVVRPAGADPRWVALPALFLTLTAALPNAARHTGALDWLVPAALRAAELLFVVAVGIGSGVSPALITALLLVIALHHYDLTARLEKRATAPRLHGLSLGWDGRLVVLTVAVVVGWAPQAFAVLSAYLAAIFFLSAVRGWKAVSPTGPDRTPHAVRRPV